MVSTRSKRPKRPRLQFDLSPQALKRLEAMSEITGITSQAELVRNALRIYDWLLSESQGKNVRIQIVNGEKVREVELFLKWSI